jgi:quercetin dioxygenase-like cupin family protein
MYPRTKLAIALAAILTIFGAGAAAPPAHKATRPKEMVMMADQMQFKEMMPGVSKAVLWGDPAKGPYGTITRFSKGFKAGKHYHSHNIKAVVISGTLVYDSGSGEQRLGPGSYLFEPKGKHHNSGAGDDADCVFLEQGDGAFDLIEVK